MNQLNTEPGLEFLFCHWMIAMAWQVALLVVILWVVTRWCLPWASARLKYGLWMLVPIRLVLPPTLALATGWGWWLLPQQPANTTLTQTEAAKTNDEIDAYAVDSDWPAIHDLDMNGSPLNMIQAHEDTLLADGVGPIVNKPTSESFTSEIKQPSPTQSRERDMAPIPAPIAAANQSTPLAAAASLESLVAKAPNSNRHSWHRWAMAVWLLGAVVLLVRLAIGRWRLGRILHHSVPASAAIQEMVRHCCEMTGMRNRIAVQSSKQISGPILARVVRPVILIPESFETALEPGEQAAILVHELQHVRRRDLWVHHIESLLGVIYWFHPAVWWAARETRRLREMACDEATVAALHGRRREYGLGMVKIAESMGQPGPALSLPILAARHDLTTRIQRILDPQLTVGQRLSLPALALVVVAALILIPSAGRTGQSPPSVSEQSSRIVDAVSKDTDASPQKTDPKVAINDFDSTGEPDWQEFLEITDLFLSNSNPEIADFSRWYRFISQSKQLDRVDELFAKLESQDPESASYWEQLAFAQHSFGDHAAAIISYQKALKRHPQRLPLRLLCLRCQLLVDSDIKEVVRWHLQQVAEEDLEELGLNLLAFLEASRLEYLQRLDGLAALFDHIETLDKVSVQKMDWLVEALSILILDYSGNDKKMRQVFTPSAQSEARRRLLERWATITEEIVGREQLAFSAWLALHEFEGEIPVDIAIEKAEKSLLAHHASLRLSNPIEDFNREREHRRVVAQNFSHSNSTHYEIKIVRPLLPHRGPLDFLACEYGMRPGVETEDLVGKVLARLNQQGRTLEAQEFETRFRLYRLDNAMFAQQVEAMLVDQETSEPDDFMFVRTFRMVLEVWLSRQSGTDLSLQLAASIGRVWRSGTSNPEELTELLRLYGRYCAMLSDLQQQPLVENAFKELAKAIVGPAEVQAQAIELHLDVMAMPLEAQQQAVSQELLQSHQAYALFLKLLAQMIANDGPTNGGPPLSWALIMESERFAAFQRIWTLPTNKHVNTVRGLRNLEYPFYIVAEYEAEQAITDLMKHETDVQKIIEFLELTPFLKSVDHFEHGLTMWRNVLKSSIQMNTPYPGSLIRVLEERNEQNFGSRLLLLMLRQFSVSPPARIEVYDLLLDELELFKGLPPDHQRKIAMFIDGITDDGIQLPLPNAPPSPWKNSLPDHPVAKIILDARMEVGNETFDRLMRAEDFDELEVHPGAIGGWARSNLFPLMDQEPSRLVTALVQLSKLMRRGTKQVFISSSLWGTGRRIDIDQAGKLNHIFQILIQDKGTARALEVFSAYAEHPETQWFDIINFSNYTFTAKLKSVLNPGQAGALSVEQLSNRLQQISGDLAETFTQPTPAFLLIPFFYSLEQKSADEITAIGEWARMAQEQDEPFSRIARLWELAADLHLVKSKTETNASRLVEPNQFQEEWIQWIVNSDLHLNTRWALATTVFLNDPTLPASQAKQCLSVIGEMIVDGEIEDSQRAYRIVQAVSELIAVDDDQEFNLLAAGFARTLARTWESGKPFITNSNYPYRIFQFLHRAGEDASIGQLIKGPARNSLNIHSEALLIELGYAEFLVDGLTHRWPSFNLQQYLTFLKTGKLRNSNWNTHAFTATLETRLSDLLSRIEDPGIRFTAEVYYSSLPDSSFPEQQPIRNRAERLRPLAIRFSEQKFEQRAEKGLALVLLVNEPQSRDLIMPAVMEFARELPPTEVWRREFYQSRILLAAAAVGGLQKSDPHPFHTLVRHVRAGSADPNNGGYDSNLSQLLSHFLEYSTPVSAEIPAEAWDEIENDLSALAKIVDHRIRPNSEVSVAFRAFLDGIPNFD